MWEAFGDLQSFHSKDGNDPLLNAMEAQVEEVPEES
jgi:hypothetical protein